MDEAEALRTTARCALWAEPASNVCPEDNSATASEAEIRAFRRILDFRGAERQSTFYPISIRWMR